MSRAVQSPGTETASQGRAVLRLGKGTLVSTVAKEMTRSTGICSMITDEPTQREATIVVRYWWCGSPKCGRLHKTKVAAANCIVRNRKELPDLSERNERIWRMVIEEGFTLADAGKAVDISASRVKEILDKAAMKRGINYMDAPPKVGLLDYIRDRIAKGNLQKPQDSHDLSIRAMNRMRAFLGKTFEPVKPVELAHLTPQDLRKIPQLGKHTRREIIRWMQVHGYWKSL